MNINGLRLARYLPIKVETIDPMEAVWIRFSQPD